MRTHEAESAIREALTIGTESLIALDHLVTEAARADELERQNEELRQCARDCKEKERMWIEECSRLRSLQGV